MTSDEQTVVLAKDVVFRFGTGVSQRAVLNGLNLEARPGQFIAIRGASGAGKTTLMTLLAGLRQPSAGTISVAGQALHGATDTTKLLHKRVRCCFQQALLLPYLTAEQNVLGGMCGVDSRARAEQLRGSLGISHVWLRRPSTLSAGEQHRVSLARALVTDPDLLLADEPTAALDEATTVAVGGLLRDRCAEGMSVVAMAHDSQLLGIADHLYELKEGRLVQER